MEFKNIIYEKGDGIATITLNRPQKLNATDIETVAELSRALDEAEDDDEVRVVVLTGAGDRAFCAGNDVSMFEGFDSVSALRSYMKRLDIPTFFKVEKLSKPVIAAVNGLALGGGLELAMVCDITIASEKATFSLPESRVGLIPGISVLRLEQAVGSKKAMELMLTCDTIDAKEAERIGLVNKVVPPEQLGSAVKEMAQKIMASAPLSNTLTKAAANRNKGGEDLAYIIEAAGMLFGTEDLKEGYSAFLQKRSPQFKGR